MELYTRCYLRTHYLSIAPQVGQRNLQINGEKSRDSSKASAFILALVIVSFFIFITLAFSPLIASEATKIPSAIESPLFNLGASAAAIPAVKDNTSPRASNDSAFFYVGASTSSSAAEKNSGVRSYIQVRRQNISDGVLSFWISEALSNNMWAQTGYYIDNGSTPIAFYQIWNLTNRAEITTGTKDVSSGGHLFSIISIPKTDNWNFTLDGKTLGTFDMGVNISSATYPIYAMSEEGYTQAPFSFNPVLFKSAIQVFKVGVWTNASTANSFGSDWGLQGHTQNSLIGNDAFMVGSGYEDLAANSNLWV